ncbi:Rv3654c family TadE-like protein [Streptomyces violaceorubidus]|uniref:Rv3654c family TadE-like protein n=1 Tax=Streptomyces violaceorubidus TaxID=284042 RepID=UPI003D9F3649
MSGAVRDGARPRSATGRGDTAAGTGTDPADGHDQACAPASVPASSASDRGSATVWSVVGIAVLCLVFGVVLALGQAVVARHRAAGGADLAALAAADHWARGGTAACERASRVARAQNARLVRCVITGQVSDVTASSGRGPFAAEVRARAGPAPPTTPGPALPTAPGPALPTTPGPAPPTSSGPAPPPPPSAPLSPPRSPSLPRPAPPPAPVSPAPPPAPPPPPPAAAP